MTSPEQELGVAGERLLSELQERRRRGETPARAEYAGRVEDELIEEAFSRLEAECDTGTLGSSTEGPPPMSADDWGTLGAASPPVASSGAAPRAPLTSLDEYRLDAELGRGGMGVVYRGWDRKLHRTVAVKTILNAQLASQQDIDRFLREGQAAAQLDHPGIVPVYGIGECEGIHYLAMAYVDGDTLWSHIKGDPLDDSTAARMALQIADAVEAAHQRGIVHRDLKPENVLLDSAKQPRVTDFGLAKQFNAEFGSASTGIVGTPAYMSPEQSRGDEVDVRSDVYSIGATLYAMLAGRPPFEGRGVDVLSQVANREPVPLRRLNPVIPRDLETICQKCMEKEAARRYASARQVADELERFLDGRPILARPVSSATHLIRLGRRHPWTSAIAIAGLVILVTASIVSSHYAFQAKQALGVARGNAEDANRQAALANQNAERAKKKTLEAVAAERDANRQRRLAESLQLVAQSKLQLRKDGLRALRLAAQAAQTHREHGEQVPLAARQALYDALRAAPDGYFLRRPDAPPEPSGPGEDPMPDPPAGPATGSPQRKMRERRVVAPIRDLELAPGAGSEAPPPAPAPVDEPPPQPPAPVVDPSARRSSPCGAPSRVAGGEPLDRQLGWVSAPTPAPTGAGAAGRGRAGNLGCRHARTPHSPPSERVVDARLGVA